MTIILKNGTLLQLQLQSNRAILYRMLLSILSNINDEDDNDVEDYADEDDDEEKEDEDDDSDAVMAMIMMITMIIKMIIMIMVIIMIIVKLHNQVFSKRAAAFATLAKLGCLSGCISRWDTPFEVTDWFLEKAV